MPMAGRPVYFRMSIFVARSFVQSISCVRRRKDALNRILRQVVFIIIELCARSDLGLLVILSCSIASIFLCGEIRRCFVGL
jgi:hypothetical protein